MRRVALITLALVAGCSEDLPRYSEIRDLRILHISATPPTFLYDQPTAEITFQALVVDPAGYDVEYSWTFCPIESSQACADFDTEIADLPAETATVLSAAHALTQSGLAVAPTADENGPTEALPAYDVAAFSIPASQLLALTDYYLQNQIFGYGLGLWPSVVFTASRPGEQVVAAKRFVVRIADLAVYNDMIEPMLGYEFCSDAADAAPADDCVAWQPELAGNDNPLFAKVQYSEGDSALANWLDLPSDAALVLAAGSSIRLLPILTAESSQSYQTIRGQLQTGTIETETRSEEISVSWFCSAGRVKEEVTWPKYTRALDTVYEAPATPPASSNGLVTIWLVARDQRGGESAQHITLQVE